MRIALLDGHPAGGDEPAYVAELGPVLAEQHRVTIVTLTPGILNLPATVGRIRRCLLTDRPEVLHLNHLDSAALAGALAGVSAVAPAFQPPIALTLHDDRLLKGLSGLDRMLSRRVALVVSPSAALLDAHLAQDFFASALHEVIPYGMPYHADRLVDAYRRLINARRAGSLGNRAA